MTSENRDSRTEDRESRSGCASYAWYTSAGRFRKRPARRAARRRRQP
ncbi:hypothetical protein ACFW4X_14955 [Streptomyces smyrnaeus]